MSITNLRAPEIRELISRYQSELRKLEYQINKTYSTIQELEDIFYQKPERSTRPDTSFISAATESMPSYSGGSPASARRGESNQDEDQKEPEGRRQSSKPAKVHTAPDEFKILPKKTPKKPPSVRKASGKKKRKRVVKTDGYRLSEWDNFIMNALDNQGIILRNADLYELAKDWDVAKKEKLSNTEIRGKLSRSIHKLANKRGYIYKVKFPGRGNAYALPDWFTSNGKLKKMHVSE